MITIKTPDMEIVRKKGGILSANYAMEAIYIKFADAVELTIPIETDSNKMNRLLTMLKNSTSENIVFDLTSRETPISFS